MLAEAGFGGQLTPSCAVFTDPIERLTVCETAAEGIVTNSIVRLTER